MTTTPIDRHPTTAKLLDTLRAADAQALTVAELIRAVGQRHGVRLARPTVYSALERLRVQSQVVSLDDPGQPRRWLAVPEQA